MLISERPQADGYARSHPALTDSQTGLANRLHFDLVYDYLFEAGDRGLPFTVMLVSAGVEVGSGDTDVLRALGTAIERTTRNSDLVSHVGAGRYAVLLLGTNLQGGRIACDRIEAALGDQAPGPICFGLASYNERMKDPQELLRAADTALLSAEAAQGGVEFG
ncbi:MAG: GGDEF domain-containing protein [Gemmatimonadota bacterium]|nr:GGDEF domain-containing protein [Gemmatimonadota bacterium]